MKKILILALLVLATVFVLVSCDIPFLSEKETTATTLNETTSEPDVTTPEPDVTTPDPEETTPEMPDEPITPSAGFAYKVNDDGETCTITGIGTCTDTDIYIGDCIDGYKVIAIGEFAFYNCSALTSITINDNVTSIGYGAFAGCSSLTSITINDNVTSIGYGAFAGCSSLTSITVANENPVYYSEGNCIITRNEKVLIQGCNNSIIPQDVTSIGDYAFFSCSVLTSITIPNSVTSIGDYAFNSCSALTSVTLPDSVTSIGKWAFVACTALTSIVVDNDNTAYQSIDGNLYSKNGKTLIAYAIGKTDTSFTIPDIVTSIDMGAFLGCTSLTSVTIPDGVTTIGNSAFSGCNPALYTEHQSGKYVCDGTNPYAVLIEVINKDVSTYEIHPDTKVIAGSAFQNCSRLTSITLPDGVRGIGNYAFFSCSVLTSVTIPNSVISIGDYAFYLCSSLTSVTIPDSIISIGDSAFSSCSSLTSVTIGDSVTSIGDEVFASCSYLTSVHITDLAAWCNINFSDYESNPLYYAHNLYLDGNLITELVIPDSVTSIGNYAFYHCFSLTSVTIPDSVISIGAGAFAGCPLTSIFADNENTAYQSIDGNLYSKDGKTLIAYAIGKTDTSFTIPDSVINIGDYAFYRDALTSVTIGDSVTSIGDYAFSSCLSLTSVTLPDSITNIGDYAFFRCSALMSVTIGDSVTSIGDYAFSWCSALMSVTIPDSVTAIGGWAFSGCLALTSVTIGDNVASIDDYTFYLCPALTSVTIGDSVISIGYGVFFNCDALASVTFANPNGWWYADSADVTSGTDISAASLANASIAAQYLKSTYLWYYWYCTE